MNNVTTGLMAGLMANGPVTLGMMKLRDVEKSTTPAGKIGVAEKFDNKDETKLDTSFISQLAYGTAFAVLYSLTESKVKASPLVKGGILGLGVWGLSRLGAIPSLKIPPAGASIGISQNAQMALAHVVWGASISQAVSSLKQKG